MILIRKIRSNSEIAMGVLLLSVLLTLIFMVLNLPRLIICTPLLLFVLVSKLINEMNKRFWSKHLPMDSSYNLFGDIEIHVNKNCNKNRFLFTEVSLETILIGIKEDKNILVDTWIIHEDKIREYFGDAAEFVDIGLLQKVTNYLSILLYESNKVTKPYRCIIHVGKVTEEHKIALEKRLNRIKRRSMRNLDKSGV